MDLDASFKELGQFGWFQAYYFTLLLFPVMMSGFRGTEYIFTTMNIPHRCRVPECEGSTGPTQYRPQWLSHAVPFTAARQPEACLRYSISNNTRDSRNSTSIPTCPADMFSPNSSETCSSWVFSEPARSIAHDFNIMCPQDYWKLTMFGSISVFLSFPGLPLTGFLSDKFGRKTVMVFGSVGLAITGVLRSFAPSYWVLATFEVVDGLLSGALYSPAFLLGLETLSPSKRLLGSMLINMYFPVGEMVLACIMWAVLDWRLLQRVFYVPMLSVVALHWLLPESVRWLYTHGRYAEVKQVMSQIAKMNKTEDKLSKILQTIPSSPCPDSKSKEEREEPKSTLRFSVVFKSRTIMWRFLVLALCWVANIFTYYGISQNATFFGDNRYVSFLLVSVVEVPAYVVSLWIPDWQLLGRRGAIVWSFLLGGAACLAMACLDNEQGQPFVNISLFLIAKFCSTLTITVIYVYTAELFPTELRQSLLNLCSMCGRVGSVLSQQTPLMAMYFNPMFVFGVVSLVGGGLALTCPETLGTKLPDTIEEAEQVGKTTTNQEAVQNNIPK